MEKFVAIIFILIFFATIGLCIYPIFIELKTQDELIDAYDSAHVQMVKINSDMHQMILETNKILDKKCN